MKLILDASVALPMWLPEEHSARALILRDQIRNDLHEVLAPDTLPVEVAHALTRAERQGKIDEGTSEQLFDGFLDICPTLHRYIDYLGKALQLSSKFRIGVFDCLYVAVSEEQECPIVTLDKRFLELFPDQAVSLHDL